MFWDILNAIFRLGILVIVVWKLTVYREMFIPAERIGLGFAGSAALLTIPVVANGPGSPFDGWATTLFSAGFFLYLCGRAWRHFRHRRHNKDMVRMAQEHRGRV